MADAELLTNVRSIVENVQKDRQVSLFVLYELLSMEINQFGEAETLIAAKLQVAARINEMKGTA